VTGNFTTYSLPSGSNALDITSANDGSMWAIDQGRDRLIRTGPGGATAEWDLPTKHGDPSWIATAPDGSIWFTSWASRTVSRATTSGRIDDHQVSSAPQGIAVASDGTVWFAEQLAGGESQEHIGRIGVDGTYSELALPSAGTAVQCGWQCPWDVALAPDGAVWFTEGLGQGGVGIGRVTPDGSYTHHAVNFGLPSAIVAGSDGALWFTSDRGGKLGRIALDGALSSTTIDLTAGTDLSRVATGPGGALWLTYSTGPDLQNRTGHLARVAPDGAVQRWDLPGSAVGSGLRSSADGSIWIAAGDKLISFRP
jgi:streptogramin lyase